MSALLKREVAVHRHGLAFGAQNSGATLGALLAGLALPAVAIPFGWRWAFVLVVGLAPAAAVLAPPGDGSVAPRPVAPRGLTTVHALAVAAALASAPGVGFVSFLVLYAVESGMSQAAAGLLLVAAMLAVSSAGYLLLMAREPALIVVAGVLMAGLFTGAIAGPLLVGVLAEREQCALAWSACAGFALLAACTVLAVRGPAVPRRAGHAVRFPACSRSFST